MVTWTKDQQRAIDARNSNLLISAAAGSGKTAVLVERILQMIIKDQVDIDRLLIVTFTNAAAGEMRERIGRAIMEELEKRNENECHLRRQINLLNRASISTLHSFCIDVVRKYFHLLDIDPNFRIGDGTETAIMKMEVLEELFENAYEKKDDHFLQLVEGFGGNKDDTPLRELVLGLYGFIQSKPYPKEWLKEKIEDFSLKIEDFQESPWVQSIMEQILMDLLGTKEIFLEAKNLCQKSGGPIGYEGAILEDLLLVDDLVGGLRGGLFSFYNQLGEISHKRLASLPKDVDENLKEEVKSLRQQGKDIIKNIKKNILIKSPEEYIKDLNELYPYMVSLYELVVDFEKSYHEKKVEKGIVDFNDLEHYTLKILEKSESAKEYQEKFQYIFVDEYQDSNIVQETILNFIKKNDNLFMVGDVKQSIYRFRLADPSLFIKKYEAFKSNDHSLDRRIDLKKNFRSREEIIHGVNYIFSNIMTKSVGEIDYNEDAYLYQGVDLQDMKDNAIELNLIEKNASLEDGELEEMEDMEVEGRIVAKKIKELLNTEIYDRKEEKYRKVTYQDMVVLLRTTKNWAQSFLEVFMEEGIPAYADVNTGYFEAIEVNIFMNLLKLIDNKRQDIPLLSVMRSPIGGFSIEELIKIRTHIKTKTYFEAIHIYIHDVEDDIKNKCIDFLKKLNDWKEEAKYMDMDQFIWKLLMDTGYYYYVGAMPGGIQRQANLRILMDRAKEFQNTSIKGLFNFIKFIDKLKNSSGDMGKAKTLCEKDDVVRIMSIHKSKGLEFPIVIISGMGKQFNLQDTNRQVLFHKDLGIGPKYVDPKLRQYTDTIGKIAMKNKIKLESLSEEMRILYVAFTRAKDKLILIGSIRNIEKTGMKWAKKVNPFYLSHAKSYLDWICPVLMRHPHGEPLREWTHITWDQGLLWDDPSKWVINRYNRLDIKGKESEKVITKLAFQQYLENFELTSTGDYDFVEKRLNWKYDYEEATKIPPKLSVTEIKRISNKREIGSIAMNIPPLVKQPRFMDGKKQFSGAEKGTITHFVMQHLNLKEAGTKEEIQEQIQRMIKMELLREEEASIIDIPKILKFFDSSIGKRIVRAKKVFREIPFNVVEKANRVIGELENCNEDLLIQGVIDCYFEEEDGLVLVDYKTDYIGYEREEKIKDKYGIQIQLYREALEKITNKIVKESYLYLFYLDKGVRL